MEENGTLTAKILEAVESFLVMRRDYRRKRSGLSSALRRAIGSARAFNRELQDEEDFQREHIVFIQTAIGTEMNYNKAEIETIRRTLNGAAHKLSPRFNALLLGIGFAGLSVLLYPHGTASAAGGYLLGWAAITLAVMENNRVSERREAYREIADALERMEYPEPDPLS